MKLNAGAIISRAVRYYPNKSASIDGRIYFPSNETFNLIDHVEDILPKI